MTSEEARCRLNNFASSYCSTDNIVSPRAVDMILEEGLFAPGDYAVANDLQLFPVMAQAVAAVYNIPQVTRLQLNTRFLARIYRAVDKPGATAPTGAPTFIQIYRWNDSQITSANPAFINELKQAAAIQPIIRFVRADVSGATQVFKWGICGADLAAEVSLNIRWQLEQRKSKLTIQSILTQNPATILRC